jgi:hypothetical protein
MLRKILVATALVAVIGALVFGAVNRTLAKNSSEGVRQSGNGRGSAQTVASSELTGDLHDQEYLGQGQGQGQGGRGAGGNGAGETYQPQYLSETAYQAIIGDDTAAGGNGGKGNGRRGQQP